MPAHRPQPWSPYTLWRAIGAPRRTLPLLLGVAALFAARAQSATLALPFDEDWQSEVQGAWTLSPDPRDLLAARHPAAPSAKAAFALHRRSVRVPDDWQGPVTLALYCSDDYSGVAPNPWPEGLRGRGFQGHRFKQVLIDAAVVWSADVADAPAVGTPPLIEIPLAVTAGQTFQLGLLVYDAEASETILPEDFFHGAEGQKDRAAAPDAFHFGTTVYWGDLQLFDTAGKPVPGRRPSEAVVIKRHAERWPLAPQAPGWPGDRVRLTVDDAAALPPEGFPLHFGIPFPPGKVHSLEAFRLQMPNGDALYCQKLPVALWPDESFRWVMVDLPATPAIEAVDLVFKKDSAAAPKTTAAKLDAKAQVLRAGDLAAHFGPGDLLREVTFKGAPVLQGIALGMATQGETIPGSVQMILSAADGAAHSAITLYGNFDGQDRPHGTFEAKIATFDRLPMLRLDLCLINDTGAPLPLQDLTLELALPAAPKECGVLGSPLDDTRRFEHLSATPPTWNGAALPAEGPVYFSFDTMTVVIKHFMERFPKRVAVEDNRLLLALCPAGNAPVVLNPGERLTHEIWLGFGLKDPARFADAVHRPPLLSHPAYFAQTGAVGPWPPLAEDAPLRQRLAAYSGKSWSDMGHALGLRDFTDQPHFTGPGTWSHNYTERLLGYWAAWGLTGDRAWFDRAQAFGAHLLDVAAVHGKTPEGDWAGALRGPGLNHAGPPWPPGLRNAGFAVLYHWTDDTRALQALLGMADYCIRTKPGVNAPGARHHAAPLETLFNAYRASGEATYLDAGAERIAAIKARIDRRRGAWLETFNDPTALRPLPGPAAQLGRALAAWYGLTGDLEAAHAVVALADALREEAPLTALGADAPGVAAVLAAAHDLTGDPAYAAAQDTVRTSWNAAGAPISLYDTLWLVTDAILEAPAQ